MLLDHGTRGGFETIVEAMKALLEMGQKESDDPEAEHWDVKGCHVVAPVSFRIVFAVRCKLFQVSA